MNTDELFDKYSKMVYPSHKIKYLSKDDFTKALAGALCCSQVQPIVMPPCQHCADGQILEIRVPLDQKLCTKCICTGRSIDDIVKDAFREGYKRCEDDRSA